MMNVVAGALFLYLAFTAPARADECEFIRAALAALPEEGGEVRIPAGHYTCAAPIVLERSHQRLRAEGDVTLRLADNSNAPLVVMGRIETPPAPLLGIEVSGLRLDGNRLGQQMEC